MPTQPPKRALLVLEDGTSLSGPGFGAEKEVYGEVVFCTSMTGYVEALTDPSYAGQILVMTYPLIGNYGVNDADFESDRVQVQGFVVREVCDLPSEGAGSRTVHDLLAGAAVPGMAGVDTRALTIKLRSQGVMKGGLLVYSSDEPSVAEVLEKTRAQPSTSAVDLVARVARQDTVRFDVKGRHHVVLMDCGMKRSILRAFLHRGVNVTIVPPTISAKDILAYAPDGVVISNGPGDPAVIAYTVETVRDLLGQVPMQGICLGQQLLALAVGAKTYKMKFGHRGANQPVHDLATNKVYITTQNHGFAVDPSSLAGTPLQVSSVNANDGTVEGLTHKELPVLATQYHPEGHLGPQDSEYIFDRFLHWVAEY